MIVQQKVVSLSILILFDNAPATFKLFSTLFMYAKNIVTL